MIPNITDKTLEELRAFWEQTRSINFGVYERYYGGDHPWEDTVSRSVAKVRNAVLKG